MRGPDRGHRGRAVTITAWRQPARDVADDLHRRCSCTAASCTSPATCCSCGSSATTSRTPWARSRFVALLPARRHRGARRCRSPSTPARRCRRIGASGAIAAVLGGYLLLYPARPGGDAGLPHLLLHDRRAAGDRRSSGIWFAQQILFGAADLTQPDGRRRRRRLLRPHRRVRLRAAGDQGVRDQAQGARAALPAVLMRDAVLRHRPGLHRAPRGADDRRDRSRRRHAGRGDRAGRARAAGRSGSSGRLRNPPRRLMPYHLLQGGRRRRRPVGPTLVALLALAAVAAGVVVLLTARRRRAEAARRDRAAARRSLRRAAAPRPRLRACSSATRRDPVLDPRSTTRRARGCSSTSTPGACSGAATPRACCRSRASRR